MNNDALTARVLSTFPPSLQAQVRSHSELGFADIHDLVQAAAVALLEARHGDTMLAIFSRARSASRRYTQDPVYYGSPIDGIADTCAHVAAQPTCSRKKREIAREVSADFGVTGRRARQIVAAQLERARQGDLFADDRSDDESWVAQ